MQLARGSRLTELLKQPQYQPVSVEKQVLVIFAGTNGYVDEYDLSALKSYEEELCKFVEEKHPDIFDEIREKKEIDDELREKVSAVLEEFKGIFQP
jgi:F-type H+-transporting ATPase subunit alpha